MKGRHQAVLQRISQGELNGSSRASFAVSAPLVIVCPHFVTLSLEMVTPQYSVSTPQSYSPTKHRFSDKFNLGVIMRGP